MPIATSVLDNISRYLKNEGGGGGSFARFRVRRLPPPPRRARWHPPLQQRKRGPPHRRGGRRAAAFRRRREGRAAAAAVAALRPQGVPALRPPPRGAAQTCERAAQRWRAHPAVCGRPPAAAAAGCRGGSGGVGLGGGSDNCREQCPHRCRAGALARAEPHSREGERASGGGCATRAKTTGAAASARPLLEGAPASSIIASRSQRRGRLRGAR